MKMNAAPLPPIPHISMCLFLLLLLTGTLFCARGAATDPASTEPVITSTNGTLVLEATDVSFVDISVGQQQLQQYPSLKELYAVVDTLIASNSQQVVAFASQAVYFSSALQAEQSRALLTEMSLLRNVELANASSIANLAVLAEALFGETSRAIPVELGLSSAVVQEAVRALGAELSIATQVSIATAVLRNTDASLGASLQQGTNTFSTLTATLSFAVVQDRSRAMQAEMSLAQGAASLSSSLLLETSRAVSIQTQLSVGVWSERSRALLAEASIATQGAASSTTLSSAVAQEASRAISVEAQVSAAVNREVSRATVVEGSIAVQASTRFGVVSAAVVAGQQAVSAATAAEVVRALGVEGSVTVTLSGGIANTNNVLVPAVSAGLATEISRAVTAQFSLANSVQAERSRAISIESSISTSIIIPCPPNSTGAAPVCQCLPGFSGSVTAVAGGYINTCQPVPCPANSVGVNVPQGCTCRPGYAGSGVVVGTSFSPFFSSTCTPALRTCAQIFNACNTCPSGTYFVLGSDNATYSVYCMMDAAAPIGRGWMLVSLGGNNCIATMQARTSITSNNQVFCGYMPDPQIRVLASQSSNIMLAVSNNAVVPPPSTMAYWTSTVYTTSTNAINALRTGTNWNNGLFPSAGIAITWQGDTANWIFYASCNPLAANTWPNMYHSCGVSANVHWTLITATQLHSRTSSGTAFAYSGTFIY